MCPGRAAPQPSRRCRVTVTCVLLVRLRRRSTTAQPRRRPSTPSHRPSADARTGRRPSTPSRRRLRCYVEPCPATDRRTGQDRREPPPPPNVARAPNLRCRLVPVARRLAVVMRSLSSPFGGARERIDPRSRAPKRQSDRWDGGTVSKGAKDVKTLRLRGMSMPLAFRTFGGRMGPTSPATSAPGTLTTATPPRPVRRT